MRIWMKIVILIVFVGLSYSEVSSTLSLLHVTESDEPPTTKITNEDFKIFTIPREKPADSKEQLSPDELSVLKSAGLRDLVNQTLYNDNNYRTNPKKIECIVEYFKKNNFNDEFTSEIGSIQNSTVSIKFQTSDKNTQKLQSIIDDANSSCFSAGFISIIILSILMVLIVGTVVWLNKKQARWSRFNLA
ncbi:hypothetical protein ACKWTF_015958 [Chironomus riparius]